MKTATLFFLFLLAFTQITWAQEFVDAPPVVDNGATAGAGGGGGGGPAFIKDRYHQLNAGMSNFGFSNHPYYQYSGDDDFFQGNGILGLFSGIGYLSIRPQVILNYVKGWAWGMEYLSFTSTSEEVITTKNTVVAPSIGMSANLITANGRLYFGDPTGETLQPFVGIGWGLLQGEFDTVMVGGSQTRTTFIGPATFQTFGANVMVGPRAGILLELRTITANATSTSNDPFTQNSGKSLDLDFSGTMLNFTGYYRF